MFVYLILPILKLPIFIFVNIVELLMVITGAYNMIFDEEEEEENINFYLANLNEKEEHLKNLQFFEETVPEYSPSGINNKKIKIILFIPSGIYYTRMSMIILNEIYILKINY